MTHSGLGAGAQYWRAKRASRRVIESPCATQERVDPTGNGERGSTATESALNLDLVDGAGGLPLPAVEPKEADAGAAAAAVVLDQQPRTDALHAHATLSVAFLILEGEHIGEGLGQRREGAVVGVAAGHLDDTYPFNAQLATTGVPDRDPAVRAPRADPIRCLRPRHWRDRRKRRARQPAARPDWLFFAWGDW
jgi:hypothetical protein